jgi:hypothetical protein
MTPPRPLQPRHVRYSVRHQARLDAETHTKLEELARTFHRKRAPMLRYVMQWGITRTQGWTIDQAIPTPVPPVPVLLEPALLEQMQEAAAAHGVSMAAWLRHAMRQVTPDDFPASWHVGETALRSHESGYYHRKFGLRRDEATSHKLEALSRTFNRPAAEVIRLLIMQATPEDFPQTWHVAVVEQRQPEVRLSKGDH